LDAAPFVETARTDLRRHSQSQRIDLSEHVDHYCVCVWEREREREMETERERERERERARARERECVYRWGQ
jgi:hypothetical protein